MADSGSFESTAQSFPITPGIIDESSGIDNSLNIPGSLWTIQDSGQPNSVYLVSTDGKTVKEFNVPATVNHDWEDIATGPGPQNGTNYIYIPDIGNNNPPMTATNIIYRVPEISDVNGTFQAGNVDKITFRYPDGPRDAETLLLDPVSKDLFVISKEIDKAAIYRLAYPQSTSEVIVAERMGVIPSVVFPTGGDVSADGQEILMRTYLSVYYWKRKAGETLGQTLLQPALKQLIVTPEPQGEGICFEKEAKGFYTLSERGASAGVSLNYYKRK